MNWQMLTVQLPQTQRVRIYLRGTTWDRNALGLISVYNQPQCRVRVRWALSSSMICHQKTTQGILGKVH